VCARATKVQENTNIEHNGNNNVRNDWKCATLADAVSTDLALSVSLSLRLYLYISGTVRSASDSQSEAAG